MFPITFFLVCIIFAIDLLALGVQAIDPVFAFCIAVLVALSVTYRTRSPPIHIMANYLIIVLLMPIAIAMLSYVMAAYDFPWADDLILKSDHFLYFEWPKYYLYFRNRPFLYYVIEFIYQSWFLETLIILLFLAVFDDKKAQKLVFTLTVSAAITAIVFGFMPVHDAATLYHIPNTAGYGWSILLDAIRTHQPIPADKRLVGLVSFPSMHTSGVALLIWILIPFGRKCYPVHAYNIVLALAIPVIGLHHLTDMIGGVLVALVSIVLANGVEQWVPEIRFPMVVRLTQEVRR